MKMTYTDFSAWLKEQLSNKNMRPTDLAKKARISDAVLSRILNEQRRPDSSTLISIAAGLNISPIVVFRKAGLLPEGGDTTRFEDWAFLLQQMSAEDQAELRQIAELKIERRKKEQALKSLNTKKA